METDEQTAMCPQKFDESVRRADDRRRGDERANSRRKETPRAPLPQRKGLNEREVQRKKKSDARKREDKQRDKRGGKLGAEQEHAVGKKDDRVVEHAEVLERNAE